METAIDAALMQQWIWETKENILLYKYMVRQLDSYGRAEFIFGQDFLF